MGSFCSCEGPAVVYHRRRPVNTPTRSTPPHSHLHPLVPPAIPQPHHHECRTQSPSRTTILAFRSPQMSARASDSLPSEPQTESLGLWAPFAASGGIRVRSSPRITADAITSKTSDEPLRRPRLTRLILDEDAGHLEESIDPFGELRSASTFDAAASASSSHGNIGFEALRNASSGVLDQRSSSSSESSSSPYLIQRQHSPDEGVALFF